MMSDRLLRDLGDLARKEAEAEQARLDERWDRLAAGTLTAEEETELKALATSSPEAGEAYVAFKPLGAEFQARVARKINSQRASESPTPTTMDDMTNRSAINSQRASESPAPQEKRKPVPPFRPIARRIEVWFGAAAAVAAGLFIQVLRGPSQVPEYIGPAEISVSSEVRGGERSLTPGSPLSARLRPPTDIDVRGLTARAFLSRAGGRDLRRWQPEPDAKIDDKGFVILRGTLGKDIQPGLWTIWIVVGQEGKLPDAKALQAELRADTVRHDDWKAVPTDIEVRPPPR